MIKFNPLDGDRAAEAYDDEIAKKQTLEIINAYEEGRSDRKHAFKYDNYFTNPYKKEAYKNGYYSS